MVKPAPHGQFHIRDIADAAAPWTTVARFTGVKLPQRGLGTAVLPYWLRIEDDPRWSHDFRRPDPAHHLHIHSDERLQLIRWSAHDERNSACPSRTTEKNATARDDPRRTIASLRSASHTTTASRPPAVRPATENGVPSPTIAIVSLMRAVMVSVSRSVMIVAIVSPLLVAMIVERVSRLVIVRLVMVSASRSAVIVAIVSLMPVVPAVMSVSRSVMIVVTVSRMRAVMSVSRSIVIVATVSRLVIVRLVMVSASRSAVIVVTVSRMPAVMSVSRSIVTVVIVSRMLVAMIVERVSRLVIVRLVMVSVSRSAMTAVTVSRMPVVAAEMSVSRSARTRIAVRRPTVRSGAMIPGAPIGATTGHAAPMRRRLPSASTMPGIFAAPTAQTVNGRRRLMMMSQARSWTRSPAPSCATLKRSMASGFPSTW